MTTTKANLYRTAYATIGCASFPAGACVSVEFHRKGDNAVAWFKITATEHGNLSSPVYYPEHHLNRFGL